MIYDVNCNILFKNTVFPIMGKKNIQSSVSDEDRGIQTLGSTDKTGNSVKLVPALSVYPRVGISMSAMETDDRYNMSI